MTSNFFAADAVQSLPDNGQSALEPGWVAQWRKYYALDLSGVVEQQFVRLEVPGYQLAAQYFRPPHASASLLILHGYYDHMGLYGHLIRWATNNGLAVLICDLPGHGLSTGERASINEFAEYQAVLNAMFALARQLQLPQPWHLAGQSMGGAMARDHVLQQPQLSELGELILLAPLVRPRAWRQSRLLYYGLRPFVRQIARKRSNNSTDQQFVEFLQHDPLQPQTLPVAWVGALERWIKQIESASPSGKSPIILQGDMDQTVDWRHNLGVLEQKFSQPRVCMLSGAGHHLVNEQDSYRQQIFSFLERQL